VTVAHGVAFVGVVAGLLAQHCGKPVTDNGKGANLECHDERDEPNGH
jgi:hypothetical protein